MEGYRKNGSVHLMLYVGGDMISDRVDGCGHQGYLTVVFNPFREEITLACNGSTFHRR